MGPDHALAGYTDARFGCIARFNDPGAARRRRRANGGIAKRLIKKTKCGPFNQYPHLAAKRSRFTLCRQPFPYFARNEGRIRTELLRTIRALRGSALLLYDLHLFFV